MDGIAVVKDGTGDVGETEPKPPSPHFAQRAAEGAEKAIIFPFFSANSASQRGRIDWELAIENLSFVIGAGTGGKGKGNGACRS